MLTLLGDKALVAGIDEAFAKARADTIELAVAVGTIWDTVEIIDAENVHLQYYPSNYPRNTSMLYLLTRKNGNLGLGTVLGR